MAEQNSFFSRLRDSIALELTNAPITDRIVAGGSVAVLAVLGFYLAPSALAAAVAAGLVVTANVPLVMTEPRVKAALDQRRTQRALAAIPVFAPRPDPTSEQTDPWGPEPKVFVRREPTAQATRSALPVFGKPTIPTYGGKPSPGVTTPGKIKGPPTYKPGGTDESPRTPHSR